MSAKTYYLDKRTLKVPNSTRDVVDVDLANLQNLLNLKTYIQEVALLAPSPVQINATATATAAQVASGYITSTSAAAVALTLPTATALGQAINAVKGSILDLYIDNTGGANTITVALGVGITVLATPVITGTDTLTISTANGLGGFKFVFTSATTAKLIRTF